MKAKNRIPDKLFSKDGHYFGKPADFRDRIIQRRIRLVEQIPDFVGKEYDLLDIGCGNGASMLCLANKMKSCTGYEMVAEHQSEFEAFQQKIDAKNCQFLLFNIEKDTLSQQFDRIISFEVIEHLETEDSVSFYYDALKEDGILAISVPNRWWIFETHGAKLPLLPWNRVPFFSWLPKALHEKYSNARIYSKKSIKKLLEKNGFEICNMMYITAPMDVLPNGKVKDFIIKYFFNTDTTKIPFKSTSIIIVAKKKSILA